VEANAKDGAHNGSGGTKTRRVRYEVMRCVRGYRGKHMAGGEWMMRWGRDHTDQKRGDGQMSEDEEGAKRERASFHGQEENRWQDDTTRKGAPC
jgi:hypothetical protein